MAEGKCPYFKVETANFVKVSSGLMDAMDKFDEDQERIVAEAFKDDDVIGEFEEEKEFVIFCIIFHLLIV